MPQFEDGDIVVERNKKALDYDSSKYEVLNNEYDTEERTIVVRRVPDGEELIISEYDVVKDRRHTSKKRKLRDFKIIIGKKVINRKLK